MSTDSFIIAYIPGNDGRDAELPSRTLAPSCAVKIAGTTYLVTTALTAQHVFDRVPPAPGQDQPYILTVARPYCGTDSRKADGRLRATLNAPRTLPAAPPDLIR